MSSVIAVNQCKLSTSNDSGSDRGPAVSHVIAVGQREVTERHTGVRSDLGRRFHDEGTVTAAARVLCPILLACLHTQSHRPSLLVGTTGGGLSLIHI